jgi:glycogen operon protein
MNAVPADYSHASLQAGSASPLGATWTGDGVNFAVHASGAARVELCLFDDSGEHELVRLALPERTENVWHGFLPAPHGVPGMVYGYRVHGPYDPSYGLRYNPNKLLLDPYARVLAGKFEWNPALFGHLPDHPTEQINSADSAPYMYKARVAQSEFAWSEDCPPAVPWRDTVIYELHVKGFTKLHPAVPERERGKFLGLAQPAVINYLKQLGITAVELLPVQAFVPEEFLARRGLVNYWGYSPLAWFAPHPDYCIEDPVAEFRTMVKALHAAGIEVILDVVFNHTVEGNE